jgi:hypothetical protein
MKCGARTNCFEMVTHTPHMIMSLTNLYSNDKCSDTGSRVEVRQLSES